MELFGVQELAASRAKPEPGWAYVQEAGPNQAGALQPTSRKRAARNLTSTGPASDLTAKQDAKILRDIALLDKESHRDVQIPVPVRHRDNAGRVSHGKVTPSVRKILQSQKTFANHLSDAEALAALASSQPQASPAVSSPAPSRHSPAGTPRPSSHSLLNSSGRRSHKKKDPSQLLRRTSTLHAAEASTPPPVKVEPSQNNDVIMLDETEEKKPVLNPLPPSLELKTHPADNDPLLKSRIPAIPDDAELAALIAAPPLTYLEARGHFTAADSNRPVRTFCEICGYWGRVKCLKCGTRVCALECLRTHKEDCYTRYGA